MPKILANLRALAGLTVPVVTTGPTPASGELALYSKSTGGLYTKNSAGTESLLSAGTSFTPAVDSFTSASVQSIASGGSIVFTITPWTRISSNPGWGSFSGASYTIASGMGGLYQVNVQLAYGAPGSGNFTSGRRLVAFDRNGTEESRIDMTGPNTNVPWIGQVSKVLPLAAGDVLRVGAFQVNNGTAAILLNGASTPHQFQITRLA